jgi:type I restriction enzyme S subunit
MSRWPTRLLLDTVDLMTTRVSAFTGQRLYISTGDVNENEVASTMTITFDDRPSRADLIAQEGDVLFARMQATNKVIIITNENKDYLWSTGFAALRPRSCMNSRWLAYWLASPFFNARKDALCTGATQKAITNDGIRELEIPLPPVAEQERLIRILDDVDALNRLRAQANERANQLIPTLFEEMFGDSVANSKKWPIATLGDQVALMEYGPRFYNEAYSATGTRIVRITDLDDTGNLYFEKMPRMEVDVKTLAAHGLQPGDLIFARSGATVGKLALIPENAPPCIAGAYFIRFRLKDSIEPIFARELLCSAPIQSIVQKQSMQAAQPNFSGPLLRILPMILPPESLQHDFAAHVSEICELKKRQAASRKRLDDLFLSLLHRAFQGDL